MLTAVARASRGDARSMNQRGQGQRCLLLTGIAGLSVQNAGLYPIISSIPAKQGRKTLQVNILPTADLAE